MAEITFDLDKEGKPKLTVENTEKSAQFLFKYGKKGKPFPLPKLDTNDTNDENS